MDGKLNISVSDIARWNKTIEMGIAKQIAANSPLAVTGAKRMVNYARDHSTADGLDYIATWNASMLDGDAIRQTFMAQAKGDEPEYEDLLAVKKTAGE